MKFMIKVRYFFPFLYLLILAGCQSAPSQLEFILNPDLNTLPASSQQRVILAIAEVQTSNQIYGQGMAYSREENVVEYFTKSRWVASPDKMLQDLFVQAFSKTGAYQEVIALPSDISVPLRVEVMLNTMRQYFSGNHSYVTLDVTVRLIDDRTQALIFSKSYDGQEKTARLDAASGVVAYNRLWSTLLYSITADIIHASRR